MIILWVWESAKQVSLKEAWVHQGALGIAEIKKSHGAAVRTGHQERTAFRRNCKGSKSYSDEGSGLEQTKRERVKQKVEQEVSRRKRKHWNIMGIWEEIPLFLIFLFYVFLTQRIQTLFLAPKDSLFLASSDRLYLAALNLAQICSKNRTNFFCEGGKIFVRNFPETTEKFGKLSSFFMECSTLWI